MRGQTSDGANGRGGFLRRLADRLPKGALRAARAAYGRATGRKPGGIEIPADVRARALAEIRTRMPPPHWGVPLAALARAAEMAPRPAGYGAEYDLIKPHFDALYYFGRHADVARRGFDPVAHYLRAGAAENRDPAAWFGTAAYRARYGAEIRKSGLTPFGHWVREGHARGYLTAPFHAFEAMAEQVLGRPPAEVQAQWSAQYDDLRDRLGRGTLGEMVTKAAALDPLVALSWPRAQDIRVPPFNSDLVVTRTEALHRLQARAGGRRAAAVIVVNRPRWGGGRRMEGHLAHALADLHGAENVLVLTTEADGAMPPGKLPEGLRVVTMADIAPGDAEMRERLLFEFLRALRPGSVFNVNSRLFWEMLTPYGRALSRDTAITCALFCAERTALGYWTGYPVRMVYRHFDILHAICTDSQALAEELAARFMIPEAARGKLRVLPAPADATIPVAAIPVAAAPVAAAPVAAVPVAAGRRPQIFWSGRFDPQKRVDLVHAIAAALPEADIRMWGAPVLDGGTMPPPMPPANLTREGVYAHFADLPLHEADLWLYTSDWDGVPSILLEVAMTGLPLVGSRVGGTGEILREGLAHPLPEGAGVQAHVAAIRAVLADPATARKQALMLREALLAERSEAAFRAVVAELAPVVPAPEDAA
ncbi:glycosyltransferase family 4 protein [Roseisalinus antarcticus]|uniref:Glycosyl transferases group 1 n=1 Tax=Roseisalinus antarcticus TaxID=254357 RepID=A0A1Y5TPI9_9RHOB|nr:glycosyltransferase family 4 protein [Roseisalinus antarcticus]SLN68884.1 Glycosyl transferases group 1 [Roseisalinus antarcticus]